MSSNWWSQKLTGQPAQPQAPAPQPIYAAPQPATYVPPAQPQYPPAQQATPQASQCPACRSGNYGAVGSQITQNGSVSTYRCYDCGYPLVQAGSGRGGATSAPSSGPAQKARQVATGGWNPTTIIGRLE